MSYAKLQTTTDNYIQLHINIANNKNYKHKKKQLQKLHKYENYNQVHRNYKHMN